MGAEPQKPVVGATTIHYTRTGRISKAKKGLKVWNCDCGRSYTRAEHLRRHQKNHEQGDALCCDFPECGKLFFRSDLLQRHQERHNEPGDTSSQPGSPVSPTMQPSYPTSSVACIMSEFSPYETQSISPHAGAWPGPFGTMQYGDSDSGYGSVATGTPSVAGTDYTFKFANSPCEVNHTHTPIIDDFAKTPPVPSKSGFQSGLATITESVSSVDSMAQSLGLTQDFVQDFIALFGDSLIEQSGARKCATYTLATREQEDLEKRLDMLLHDFTIKFTSEPLRSGASDSTDKRLPAASQQSKQVLRGAAILIRQCRPNIARYFCKNALVGPDYAEALSARSERPGQQLSLSGRFGLLSRSSTDHLDPDSVVPNASASSKTTDENEDKGFVDIELLQDTLVCNEGFNELASKLRHMLYHGYTQNMESIRSYMIPRSDPYHCSFEVDWSLAQFMRLQYGEQFPSVGAVIVITGSTLYAQATTCDKYIEQTWPKSDISIVQALDAFLKRSDVNRASERIVSSHRSLRISIETMAHGKLKVLAKGNSKDSIIELAQQLAWLGSALSASPFGDQVAYAKPVLTMSSTTQAVMRYEHSRLHETEQACWLPLFSGAVIASGFPIADRGDETGLEIPLNLLAGIGGVQHAVEFQGGVVMKGFSHMFVPVQKKDDRVQWHAVSSVDPDTHLTYRGGLARCRFRALSQDVGLDDISKCRAIVGWCSVAQSQLGSDSVNYENIHYSAATDIDTSTKCAGASLGFQQFGTAALDFKFGLKEGKCHFKRDGPYRNITSWAEKTPVVLYDTSERRGWLVPASDVMLHIIQCRHRLEPFEIAGKPITLDTVVPPSMTGRDVLLKNTSVKLSDDEDHTFKTEIASIWSILDFLIAENIAREQRNPGTTVESTWCDILYGFEFNAVVEQHSPYRQKQTRLSNTNGGWPLLSNDIDALVLLANGFEDIIVPAKGNDNSSLCRSWQWVPKGNDYLATNTSMLRKLYDRAGCPLDRKYLTSTSKKLQWHQGRSILFDPCESPKLHKCRCNRLQQILPRPTIGTVISPGFIDNQGAVIFGESTSIMLDMLVKPRPMAPKVSGIYSQKNGPLTPIVPQQDSEDAFCSDGGTSGESGSNSTLASTPSSWSSCSSLPLQTFAPKFRDAWPIIKPDLLPRKRGRWLEIVATSSDEDDELFMNTERKRVKSIGVRSTPSPEATDNDRKSSDSSTRQVSHVDKHRRMSGMRGELPVITRDSAPKSALVSEGNLTGFSTRIQDSILATRYREVGS